MTHLMRTQSAYRALYQPQRQWKCLQIQGGQAQEFDAVLSGQEPSQWVIIAENQHEAWLWDTKKYWYRAEKNEHLATPRYENRPDVGDWEQEFLLERAVSPVEFPYVITQCLDFETQIKMRK
jgi:hypothetical protein